MYHRWCQSAHLANSKLYFNLVFVIQEDKRRSEAAIENPCDVKDSLRWAAKISSKTPCFIMNFLYIDRITRSALAGRRLRKSSNRPSIIENIAGYSTIGWLSPSSPSVILPVTGNKLSDTLEDWHSISWSTSLNWKHLSPLPPGPISNLRNSEIVLLSVR